MKKIALVLIALCVCVLTSCNLSYNGTIFKTKFVSYDIEYPTDGATVYDSSVYTEKLLHIMDFQFEYEVDVAYNPNVYNTGQYKMILTDSANEVFKDYSAQLEEIADQYDEDNDLYITKNGYIFESIFDDIDRIIHVKVLSVKSFMPKGSLKYYFNYPNNKTYDTKINEMTYSLLGVKSNEELFHIKSESSKKDIIQYYTQYYKLVDISEDLYEFEFLGVKYNLEFKPLGDETYFIVSLQDK